MKPRREYRSTYTELRHHPKFFGLSAPAKLYFHTLKLELPVIGIGPCMVGAIAELASLPIDQARAGEAELIAGDWIKREGAVVWIVNGLEHAPNLKPKDPKHRHYVQRLVGLLPKSQLRTEFRERYAEWFPAAEKEPEKGASKGPSGRSIGEEGNQVTGNLKPVDKPDSPLVIAREALTESLPVGPDREALETLLARVDHTGASTTKWVYELRAMIDPNGWMHGQPGDPPGSPQDLGFALQDYVGNGDHTTPNLEHFRGYYRRALRRNVPRSPPTSARDRPPSRNGQRPVPEYANKLKPE